MGNKLISQRTAKVLILGLDGSGKTTLLYKFKGGVDGRVPTYTIGFNTENFEYKKTLFTCWDINGQERIRPLWRHYYYGVDGLIYVVDSRDQKRLEESWKVFQEHVYDHEELDGVPVVIVLNKFDVVEDRISALEYIEMFDLCSYFEERGNNNKWFVVDASASKCKGLENVFRLLHKVAVTEEPEVQYYHFKHSIKIRQIWSQGWKPETHLFFPTKFREKVWGLILIHYRRNLAMDTVRIILSFLVVPFQVLEMKRISLLVEQKLISEAKKL